MKNNPISFVDPNGKTEFWFNGKWAGTDGNTNGMIGLVKNKAIYNEIRTITEQGKDFSIGAVNNGMNNDNVLIVHKDIIVESMRQLGFALSEEGETREFATSMNPNSKGGFDRTIDTKGPVVDLSLGVTAGSDVPQGAIGIHSHVTGTAIGKDKLGKVVRSMAADDPSGIDKEAQFPYRDMSIIVGKNGLAKSSIEKNQTTGQDELGADNRGAFINFFNKGGAIKSISLDEGTKILKGDRKTTGKKYEKAGGTH